jgi:acyl carrier protein
MDKINEILANNFKIPLDRTLENASMDEISTWDSLTHMGLIVAIEDEFGFELSGDDIADMITFDSIRSTVKKYQNL